MGARNPDLRATPASPHANPARESRNRARPRASHNVRLLPASLDALAAAAPDPAPRKEKRRHRSQNKPKSRASGFRLFPHVQSHELPGCVEDSALVLRLAHQHWHGFANLLKPGKVPEIRELTALLRLN